MNNPRRSKSSKLAVDQLVGHQLRLARLRQGLRLADVAQKFEMSVSQIQKYEAGVSRIDAILLWRFSQFFEKPVGYFFKDNKSLENQIESSDDELRGALLKTFEKIKNPKDRLLLVDLAKQFSRR